MARRSLLVIALIIVGVTGCSEHPSSHDGMTASPLIGLAVSPSDGEESVRLDAAITFTFAEPVDRVVVERNIHLISERMMVASGCPDSAAMPHPGMEIVMTDSSMMHHMDRVHATPGRFTWNELDTECSFRPDSMMTPLTRYMIHMGSEMMRAMTNNMGMMGGHGAGMMAGDMMFHFVTMDTSIMGDRSADRK